MDPQVAGWPDFLNRSIRFDFRRFPDAGLEWRLAAGFFARFALGRHLCACPAFTAAIPRREPEREIVRWDVPLRKGHAGRPGPAALGQGMEALRAAPAGFPGEAFWPAVAPSPFGEGPPAGHPLNLLTQCTTVGGTAP